MSHPFGRQPDEPARRCRCCGCTDLKACVDPETSEPCYWVEADLCSACDPYAAIERELPLLPMSWPEVRLILVLIVVFLVFVVAAPFVHVEPLANIIGGPHG